MKKIETPINEGDTLYRVGETRIIEGEARKITITGGYHNGCFYFRAKGKENECCHLSLWYYISDLGKVVFRTSEEAEKAFAKMKRRANICKIGDIVRVQDCHHAEPHFYEVSSFKTDHLGNSYAVSQPADYSHSVDDITAIYRYNGKDLKCIWEKGESVDDRG